MNICSECITLNRYIKWKYKIKSVCKVNEIGHFRTYFSIIFSTAIFKENLYLDSSLKQSEISMWITFYFLKIFLVKLDSPFKFIESKHLMKKVLEKNFQFKKLLSILILICNNYFHLTKVIHARNVRPKSDQSVKSKPWSQILDHGSGSLILGLLS